MEFYSITFLQIAEEFMDEYLTRSNEGIEFWTNHMKTHKVKQSIRGASLPKFFVTMAIWHDEDAFNSYLKSNDRIKYSEKYVQFYGDRYLYKILDKVSRDLEQVHKPRYCSYVRYMVKKDKLEEFIKRFSEYTGNLDFENSGIDQSLLLQNPKNPVQIANITIWKDRNSAMQWEITEEIQEFIDTFLEHPRDTIFFDIFSLISFEQ